VTYDSDGRQWKEGPDGSAHALMLVMILITGSHGSDWNIGPWTFWQVRAGADPRMKTCSREQTEKSIVQRITSVGCRPEPLDSTLDQSRIWRGGVLSRFLPSTEAGREGDPAAMDLLPCQGKNSGEKMDI